VAKPSSTRRLVWVLLLIFVLAGVYLAWTSRFESWAGRQLQKAVPTARHVIPRPAKEILRESREHLPIYGPATQWLARKSASVVYFGIVGFFVLALRKRKPTSLKETLLVTVVAGVGMSTVIEILEFPFGEAFGSELFDLGCGAVGGLAAGLIAWPWLRQRSNGTLPHAGLGQ